MHVLYRYVCDLRHYINQPPASRVKVEKLRHHIIPPPSFNPTNAGVAYGSKGHIIKKVPFIQSIIPEFSLIKDFKPVSDDNFVRNTTSTFNYNQ